MFGGIEVFLYNLLLNSAPSQLPSKEPYRFFSEVGFGRMLGFFLFFLKLATALITIYYLPTILGKITVFMIFIIDNREYFTEWLSTSRVEWKKGLRPWLVFISPMSRNFNKAWGLAETQVARYRLIFGYILNILLKKSIWPLRVIGIFFVYKVYTYLIVLIPIVGSNDLEVLMYLHKNKDNRIEPSLSIIPYITEIPNFFRHNSVGILRSYIALVIAVNYIYMYMCEGLRWCGVAEPNINGIPNITYRNSKWCKVLDGIIFATLTLMWPKHTYWVIEDVTSLVMWLVFLNTISIIHAKKLFLQIIHKDKKDKKLREGKIVTTTQINVIHVQQVIGFVYASILIKAMFFVLIIVILTTTVFFYRYFYPITWFESDNYTPVWLPRAKSIWTDLNPHAAYAHYYTEWEGGCGIKPIVENFLYKNIINWPTRLKVFMGTVLLANPLTNILLAANTRIYYHDWKPDQFEKEDCE